MIKSDLLFERMPANNLTKEVYSVSAANDAANNNLARYFKAPRHAKLKDAVGYLIAQLSADSRKRTIGIAGHGNDGYVETGAGASGSSDRTTYISRANQSIWAPEIEKLFGKDFDNFFIYSCSTGAGRPGAYLLWLLARHMEKSVHARTGILYVVTQGNQVWLETEIGATWQLATGDMLSPPDPIESPKRFLKFMNKSTSFEYFDGKEISTIFFNEILKIEIIGNDAPLKMVPLDRYDVFLEQLFSTEAINLAGEIMGMVTHQIKLSTANKVILLDVYCNRIAKVVDQDVAYFLGGDFSSITGEN